MRVANFLVSLLGIAAVQVGHAQVAPVEAATFRGAVPAPAISHSSRIVPELTMPAVRQAALARGANVRSGAPVGGISSLPPTPFATTHFTQARSAMAAPSVRVGSGSSIAAPKHELQARQAPVRSTLTDHLLAGGVALMLIAYQLRRKHRVLRPHPFTI